MIWKAAVPKRRRGRLRFAGQGRGRRRADVHHPARQVRRGGRASTPRPASSSGSTRRSSNGTANIPTPVVKGDLVLSPPATATAAAPCCKLTADGRRWLTVEGAEVLRRRANCRTTTAAWSWSATTCTSAASTTQGKPACVEFKTGEIKWKEERAARRRGRLGGRRVRRRDALLPLPERHVALIKADPEEFEAGRRRSSCRSGAGQPSWPHPVIANGKLYIRDQDKLQCFDVKAKN